MYLIPIFIGGILIVTGCGLLLYRQIIRYDATPVQIINLEPYCLWKAIRGWGFYGYKCKYEFNGQIYESKLIEFGIFALSLPTIERDFIYSAVKSSSNKISCNTIYSLEKLSFLCILSGMGIIYGKVHISV